MKLRFLGTNGWYSTDTGHTVCVLVETQKSFVVFDAGNGIYKLDKYINSKNSKKPIYLFLSHFHLDHIWGLHILNKFNFKKPLTIFGQPGTRQVLQKIIRHPFTMPFKDLKIKVKIEEIEEGKHKQPKTPFPVECRYLVHADPCFGYRLKLDGKIVAYCTDTAICDQIVRLSKKADILIAECGYTKAKDAALCRGWHHLNPKDIAILAKRAKVKKLCLTHFAADLYLTLKDRKKAEKIAKKIFPETTVCFDDMEIEV